MTVEEAKERVLAIAAAEIGYHEQGENHIKYASGDIDNRLYGMEMDGLPWCDFFVDWCFIQAFGYGTGSAITYQFSGCGGASCANSASYYQEHGAFYNYPEAGDQVFFFVSGGINHTGIVENVSSTQIVTIEGNSSDQVKRNVYPIGHHTIAGYGRPMWAGVTGADVEAISAGFQDVQTGSNTSLGVLIPVTQNTLKYGDKNLAVTVAQSLINYHCQAKQLDTDGEFGILTKGAVMAFQRKYNLEVDGIVGTETWKTLLGV